jgi:arylsulfatase A-like enzyme
MNTPEFGKTQYDRAISSYDKRLGELFAAVDQTNTITLVTGDHGEKIPENELETQVEFLKKSLTGNKANRPNTVWTRQRRKVIAAARETWVSTARLMYRAGLVESPLASVTGHGYHVYDSLVRVPLVISGTDRLPQGKVISDQVRQVDIMPTILELAGIQAETPPGIDGLSLAPAIDGAAPPNLPAFIETCQNSREPSSFYGVRYEGWKYAFDADDSKVPEELYELAANPDENHNIVKAQPQKAAELQALIRSHLEQEQRAGSALADELSDDEMAGLSEHLKKLGYVE